MGLAALPHVYPFRFVDRTLEAVSPDGTQPWKGSAQVRVGANDRAAMGSGWKSSLLLVEAVAQAALLLEGVDEELGRFGFLAGIDGFQFQRPPRAGETLSVHVRLAARFGAIVKFEGEVFADDGERLAGGAVLVRKGERVAVPASAARLEPSSP